MENISKSGTCDNASPSLNRLSEPFGTGYPVLQPHEADPDPGEWPPDFKNPAQAALNAQARGFELIPLREDGTPLDPDRQSDAARTAAAVQDRWASVPQSKVGATTDGLVVVALYQDDPDFDTRLRKLRAENTAAMLSRLQRRTLFFFRLPRGAHVIEGTLPSGVDVLTEGCVVLPSGRLTDACRWLNRYAIAQAPLYLLNQFAPLAEVQMLNDNDTTGAASSATDRTFFTNALLPPAHILNAAGGVQ
jgi:Bifunctional DNA primase/polymerase, N-terminal